MSERPRDFEERARYGAVPFHHLSWLVFWMGLVTVFGAG